MGGFYTYRTFQSSLDFKPKNTTSSFSRTQNELAFKALLRILFDRGNTAQNGWIPVRAKVQLPCIGIPNPALIHMKEASGKAAWSLPSLSSFRVLLKSSTKMCWAPAPLSPQATRERAWIERQQSQMVAAPEFQRKWRKEKHFQ